MSKSFTFLFVIFTLCVNGQGINFFEGTWEEALAKAKIERKEIFVDIYTTWCGPCKELDKTTFRDRDLGYFMNAHFVSIKVEAENGPHRNMAYAFGIGGYPTMIFLDENGIEKIQARGFKNLLLWSPLENLPDQRCNQIQHW